MIGDELDLRISTKELTGVVDVDVSRISELDVDVKDLKALNLFGHREREATTELRTVRLTPEKIWKNKIKEIKRTGKI